MQCAAILAACALGLNAGAQTRKTNPGSTIKKSETVVIRKDGSDKTVIEIRDGGIFVNGDEVASLKDGDDRNLNKKIVIENGRGRRDGDWPANDDDDRIESEPRAALGVYTDPSSREHGALLKGIMPGSAAEKAGLRSGDLITSINGRDITSADELVRAISGGHKPGDEVLIGYERGGKNREIKARLGRADSRSSMRRFGFGPEGGMNMPEMPGAMFRPLPIAPNDDAAAPKLGVSAEDRADGRGVRVLAVKPGSAAAQAGIREGDVLTRIDDEPIGSVDELQAGIRSHKAGDRLELRYERSGKAATANVLLPKELRRKDL